MRKIIVSEWLYLYNSAVLRQVKVVCESEGYLLSTYLYPPWSHVLARIYLRPARQCIGVVYRMECNFFSKNKRRKCDYINLHARKRRPKIKLRTQKDTCVTPNRLEALFPFHDYVIKSSLAFPSCTCGASELLLHSRIRIWTWNTCIFLDSCTRDAICFSVCKNN